MNFPQSCTNKLKAAKGAEGTETAEGAKKADDDVVDAEVVDEDKK